MNRKSLFTPLLLALFGSALLNAEEKGNAFAEVARDRVRPQPGIRGDDPDWFFLVKELRHLGTGEFWTQPWEDVAANNSDPVPSIREFHDLLAARGIGLILVPVPPKATIYPEKLDKNFAPGDVYSASPFLDGLAKQGIQVIDLEPEFLKRRSAEEEGAPGLYCAQDAHYSPTAIEWIADRIAGELESYGLPKKGEFTLAEPENLTITGDLVAGSQWEGSVQGETFALRKVLQDGETGVTPDPESPVLLLGDSHTLVFHEGASGGMHCEGAGLPDHLSRMLGLPVDLVGVRGSGMVQARKQLFYKATAQPDYWSRKKVVIWVFSMREFTQSTDRLISIPLDR